ncbi:MAG TPA: sensor histidine kinase, partial [Micromonosporaceae bacterium]|nr:sensor histidine kinase [Micromonosporaceae bacterium]
MASRAALYRTVETAIDNEIVNDASALRDSVERQIIIDVGLLFGIVLVAMLIAWFVARSMNRSLRELKHGALTVARQGLPQAVARLRDPTIATQLSPQQIALQIAEPLPVRSRDEFGEVTEAFNAVHIEAVRTAAEQAVLRSSVATMFVNLARRSQILVDRLIGHLDRLERGEEDPDRLAELFQLDHLATRMRRNDENLLVLAGADSTRVQREPAPLVDVLRAAQSEVEHYTRVEFGSIDRDLEVASHAVNDLVHLVAELLDNATAFSPPDSPVLIEARRFGDRAVLYVEDRGIGISADQLAELNERLEKPPLVDVAVSRMMGLVVVARLAARHAIEVKLRPASDRGTVADVLLPPGVLVNQSATFRGQPAAVGAERAELGAGDHRPPPRAPFGPPLALEGGPSAHQPVSSGYGNTSGYAGAGYGASSEFGGFAAAADGFGANRPALLGPGVSSRALPSWSDLTGATITSAGSLASLGPGGGVNGAYNGAGGPYSGGGFNGNGHGGGSGQGPQGYQSSPLPRRSPQGGDGAPGFDSSSYGPHPFEPRSFDDPAFDRPPPGTHSFEPHPFEPRSAATDQDADRPRVPRQRPQAFEPLDEDRMAQEFADAELVDDSRRHDAAADSGAGVRYDDRPAPSGAPPSWPPVAPATDDPTGGRAPSSRPDMTEEIPRYRDVDFASAMRGERQSYDTQAAAPSAPAARPAPYQDPRPGVVRPEAQRSAPDVMSFADETMELPIFRALESAWFATSAPGGGGRIAGGSGRPEMATADAASRAANPGWATAPPADGRTSDGRPAQTRSGAPAGAPPGRYDYYSDTTGGNQMAGPATSAGRPAEPDWHTNADDGWRAAAAASEPADGGTTTGGLPRRVPLAQLVPGSVERAATGSNRRSPDAVRGLLSAYHRGVQRGRQQTSDEMNAGPESTSGRSAPGGKEQDR